MVLADEPTGNLDLDSMDQVYDLLRQINRELGIAFTIATHDRHIAEMSDRVIEMRDGKIIEDYLTKDKSNADLWERLAPPNCKMRANVKDSGQLVCDCQQKRGGK